KTSTPPAACTASDRQTGPGSRARSTDPGGSATDRRPRRGARRSHERSESSKASRGTAQRLGVPESSPANADDRLPRDPLGRVEGGDSVVEARDVADIGPQSSVPHPLDDLTQLGTIGLDDEVNRQAVGGPRPG